MIDGFMSCAQPATAPARNAQSQERPLAARVLDDRVASNWGLQPQEWARYRELISGNRHATGLVAGLEHRGAAIDCLQAPWTDRITGQQHL